MSRARCLVRALLFTSLLCCCTLAFAQNEPDLHVLFLGDNGPHQPAARNKQLQPVFLKRGIDLTYTDNLENLNPKTLAGYDGLMIYANHTKISPDQERALLDYVAAGKGLIPLHCATYCFLNSPEYVALCGAQFKRHGTEVFRTQIIAPDHPVMKGFRGFESWDETYVHHRHNDTDRTVLETRAEGDQQEPWTWVRNQGKGRVFYTAWGHDERTWANPGFHNLVERGTRWACGKDPAVVPPYSDRVEMTEFAQDAKPFEFMPATIPFYPPSKEWGKLAEPFKQMQKPLPPAESVKHMVTPIGFKPELFVSEPDLQGKPICMNWDERGRLWVCETVDYPNNMQPAGQGNDRIRICEDTDGDSKADRFTVFADKLSIPTGLAFHRGGIIVHQAPETLFLKDTDGDDVADVRQTLMTGWHTNDTHAGPSNIRYGHDNWYYNMVGYAGFKGEVNGEVHDFRTGFFRFQMGRNDDGSPKVTRLEFLRNTNNNSWGIGLSEEGVLFGSTANGNPSVYMPIANRFYEAVRGWNSTVLGGIGETPRYFPVTENVREVDHHGNFTAAAGHALYTARVYPQEYWNRTAFVTDPTGHLVATFVIQPQGADFRSKNSWNLLASRDEWTSPVMAEVGPDGSVWVIDWYNFIVQHNPTPAGYKNGKGNAFEIELRDKKHGRVYRIVPTDRPVDARLALSPSNPAELVATLSHPNMTWRLHAQRLLIERGKTDVLPALWNLAQNSSIDAVGINPGAIHATWTLNGLKALDSDEGKDLLKTTIRHPSPGVRRAAILSTPRTVDGVKSLLGDPKGVGRRSWQDTDPQVKLAAILTLAEMPNDAATSGLLAPEIYAALNDDANAQDHWLVDAITAAAARHDLAFLQQTLLNNRITNPAKMAEVTSRVAEHFSRGKPTGEQLVSLLTSCANGPGREVVADTILVGLVRGVQRDQPHFTEAQQSALESLVPKLTPSASRQLIALGNKWGIEKFAAFNAQLSAGLLAVTRDEMSNVEARVAAAKELIDFRRTDAEAAIELLKLIGAKSSPEFANGLLEAVGRSEVKELGPTLINLMTSWTPLARNNALRLLLSRVEWTDSLVAAAEKGQLSLGELALDQKQALAVHPNSKIAGRAKKLLSRGGGLPNPDRQKVLDELMPLAKIQGDAGQGKEVFKKQCAKCHVHSGEGTKIGPELTGMSVHPKHELLVHILDPSRSVEGNYRVYTVVLEDGRTLSGLLASESKTAIEIYDAEGKKHAIQRSEIDEIVASSKSLMPDGFEKQVKTDEIVNLLEFLTKKGKYVPLPVDKVATIVTTKGMFNSEEATVERLIFADWNPKTFEGVPFLLVDPMGDRVPNAIMLYGNSGTIPKNMPKSVTLPCNTSVKTIHFLSGVSGWGFPSATEKSVSVTVRLIYANGETEDHELRNGVHFADYIRRVDVPESKFAFALRGQQIRYLTVTPKKADIIERIELIKGPDNSVPVVMAVTIETPQF